MPRHVERLLACGADPNRRGTDADRSALQLAFIGRDTSMAKRLLEAGADRTIGDAAGVSLEAALGPGGEDIRPVEICYEASKTKQELVIEARYAIFRAEGLQYEPPSVGRGWADLILSGLAAGASFDPRTSNAAEHAAQGVRGHGRRSAVPASDGEGASRRSQPRRALRRRHGPRLEGGEEALGDAVRHDGHAAARALGRSR